MHISKLNKQINDIDNRLNKIKKNINIVISFNFISDTEYKTNISLIKNDKVLETYNGDDIDLDLLQKQYNIEPEIDFSNLTIEQMRYIAYGNDDD